MTQKVLRLTQAATQGFEANAREHLKRAKGRVENPWFRPMIFCPGADAFGPWRCLPLSGESLAEALRLQASRAHLLVDDSDAEVMQ